MTERTFTSYLARAQSLYDAGFAFEANRKDALDFLNRAHECTQNEVHDELLKADDATRRIDRGLHPQRVHVVNTHGC